MMPIAYSPPPLQPESKDFLWEQACIKYTPPALSGPIYYEQLQRQNNQVCGTEIRPAVHPQIML